jgi:fibronectin type 3 domain-containing protein
LALLFGLGSGCSGGGGGGPAALSVVSTSPANHAVDVPTDAVVTLDFNVPLDANTVGDTVEVKDLASGTIGGTRTASGSRLTFTPSAPMRANALFTVSLWDSVRGTGGERMTGSYSFTFTTKAMAPVPHSVGGVVSGLAAGASLVLQDNFADDLTVSSNGAFTFAIRLDAAANYHVSVKTQPTGQTCNVTNGNGSIGNADVTGVTVTCTTDTPADTTPPTIVSKTPASSASGVAINASITVTFSEPMSAASLTAGYSGCTSGFRFTTSANSSACVPGALSLSGATLTLTPTSPLANGTFYTVFVTNLAADVAGNVLGTASSWGFSTIEAAPAAPGSVAATAAPGQVTLTWAASSGASSYDVYWATAPGVTVGSDKVAAVSSGWVHTGRTNGATYYYRVAAVNSGGASPLSSEVSAMPQVPPPGAPAGLGATAGDGQVTLTWTAATGAASYTLYWSTAAGVTTASTKVTGVSSGYVHAGRANGTACFYRVSAVNAGGESGLSNEASATPQVPLPGAPTGLVATAGNGQVTLTWSGVLGPATYNLYWSSAAGVTASSAKIAPVASGYVHASLANGSAYYYRVSAVNAGGEGALSPEVTATPQPPAPAKPVVTVAAGPGQQQVTATWAAVPGATSYSLYWSTASGVTTASTQVGGVTSPYTLNGLAPGSPCYVRVSAVNGGGETLSNEVYTPTLVAAPANLAASAVAYDSVSLTWSAATGATAYTLYWAEGATVTTSSSSTLVYGTTKAITGLKDNTGYSFRVAGSNSAGAGALSGALGVSTAPYWVLATHASGGDAAVQLSWTPVAGAATYKVYWNTSGNVSAADAAQTVTAPGTMLDHAALTNGTRYCYRVAAVSAQGVAGPIATTDSCAIPDLRASVRAWSPGLAVAKGTAAHVGLANGGVLRSTDAGAHWSKVDARWTSGFSGLAYGAGRFVVLTYDSSNNPHPVLISTDDGLTWTAQATTLNLVSIAHGNGRFVAGALYGLIYTSTDGFTWTQAYSNWGSHYRGAAYGTYNGSPLFVAVGDGGRVSTSADGLAWTSSAVAGGVPSLDRVAVQGNVVLVAAGTNVYKSTDGGITFTSGGGLASAALALAGGEGLFVAAGAGGYLATSPDGAAWTTRATGTTQTLWSLAYDGADFMAAGASLTVLTSASGTAWSLASGGADAPVFNAVGASATGFVALGNAGAVRTSSDGAAWTAHDLATSADFLDVAFGNGMFVAVLSGGGVATSTNDGATWKVTTSPQPFARIFYKADTNVFVATDGAKYYTSPDARSWIGWVVNSATSAITFTGAAGGNGVFALVGSKQAGNTWSAYALSSTDLATWSETLLSSLSNGSALFSREAVFGAGAFVFATNYAVYRSTAPPAWVSTGLVTTGRVRFTGNRFLRGALLTSADGAVWAQRNPGVNSTDAACLGSTCVFIGADALIASITGAGY